MKKKRQYGFTMIELLVVIAIIGLLAAALITNMAGGLESSRALKCKANLKNLAQAVIGFSAADDVYIPCAGSFEWSRYNHASQNTGDDFVYLSVAAWVTWVPRGSKWPYPSEKSEKDQMSTSVFYDTVSSKKDSPAFYSITNGVLWSGVGKDAGVYVCETHKKVMERELNARVYRSYVMNRYFGFEKVNYRRRIELGDINQSGTAAIRLLLTELPAQEGKVTKPANPLQADSVLDPDNNESLGFNHKVGNRWVAHVAFADGHVDGIVEPAGANSTDLKDLATQLCNGTEIEATLRAKMQ